VTADFKFGRNPGHIPVGLKDLTWYVAGALPQPPPSVSVPTVPVDADGTLWGMDGNDRYGDCGVAGVNHMFMAAAAVTGVISGEEWPSDQQVVDYYLTYTGGQDTGVVLADFLGYVRKNPFYGHMISGYAPVGVHDIPTLQFTVDAYTAAYAGIKVTKAMQEAFQDERPWTLSDLLSPVMGGHCVSVVGYDDSHLYCVSWGGVQAISYAAWHYISDEAWAVIPKELTGGDGRGVDLAALQGDLAKLDR
jgi:hypothetical protein